MFVRSLRLAGFKSFAEPTTLEFERGVNVIVGPNGSGKSNISDALSWVLGSQAPSSLRGASMEDVIFAGSSSRPRLSLAEVELTLDNSSGILPLDLSEVSVSRSTDRSGASEYRINGTACRLLDIMELLSDTGVGRSLHTVVGQGQLDAVLQAKAEDRRAFIEEAAQIGKFRRRKDRALRKLERVDANMMRINDVLAELTRAIRPLKRQAKAAAQYSELLAEHRGLRQRLMATELHRLARQEASVDIEEERRKASLLDEELAHVRAMLGSAASERTQAVTAAEKAQDVAHGIARAADRLGSLERLAVERAALIGSRLAVETEEGYRERIRLLEGEQERWNAETTRMRSLADTALQKVEASRAAAAEAKAAAEAAERNLAEARRGETEAAQALVRAEGAEAAGRSTVGSLESRVQAAIERREVASRALVTQRGVIEEAEREVARLERDLDDATETAAEAEARLEDERERTRALRDQLGASSAQRAAAQARVDALREVEDLLRDLPEARARIDRLVSDSEERARVAHSGEDEARAFVIKAEAAVESRWLDVAKHDEELRRLDALMSGAAERLNAGRRKHEAREIELAALDEELSRVRDALAGAERAAIEERAVLPERRAIAEERAGQRQDAEKAVGEARARAEATLAESGAIELESRGSEEKALAAQLRLEEAVAGIADAQRALEGLEDRRADLRAAQARVQRAAEIAASAATRGDRWASEAEVRAAQRRDEAHSAERRLNSLRARERELEDKISAMARVRNEAEVRRAETRARTTAVGERAMDEWGLSVAELLALDPFEVDEELESRTRADKLDREMKRLGPVNPNAAEEYTELAERETFLQEQIEDLKGSKRDLMKVVREVDTTIVEVFGTAFEDVAREFEGVFQRLFPGGSGSLKLTDPGDLLNSGIEVEARPPGKNVRKLSLLSGGERSLVALAFLFAIFRARPSPFYLLDEVEAALDDINLSRFLGLVSELEEHAQVMVVTHQKRTMEAGDVLYGVSMNKDGVSRVIAKRMEEITL